MVNTITIAIIITIAAWHEFQHLKTKNKKKQQQKKERKKEKH